MPTDTDQIIEDACNALNALQALEDELLSETKEIKRTAAQAARLLAEDERQRIEVSEARLKDLYKATRVLALQTLKEIDDSEGVNALKEELGRVNANLTRHLEQLKAVDRYARVAADASAKLAKVAAGVGKWVV